MLPPITTPTVQPPDQIFLAFAQHLLPHIQPYIDSQLEPIKAELAYLKSQQSEWVSQKEAMKILNVSANWIKVLRDKPGTLIEYKLEGKTQKLPRYYRPSLDLYNAAKTRRPTLIETLHPNNPLIHEAA